MQKVPKKSDLSKLKFYKGEIRALRKEVGALNKRVEELETKMVKLYTNPDKHISKDVDKRVEILKRFNPKYREDND